MSNDAMIVASRAASRTAERRMRHDHMTKSEASIAGGETGLASRWRQMARAGRAGWAAAALAAFAAATAWLAPAQPPRWGGAINIPESSAPLTLDRNSTRLNSSHPSISYAIFCLKKKIKIYKTEHNAITKFNR